MIEIHINPARVEKVIFKSRCDLEEDLDWATWPAIRPLINQIDRRLKKISQDALCGVARP